MERSLITNVFSALHKLEKQIEDLGQYSASGEEAVHRHGASIAEQARIVRQMRRTAMKLQLALAKNDWINGVRLLRVFYGLMHMVRPEVHRTVSRLVNRGPNPTLDRFASAATMH